MTRTAFVTALLVCAAAIPPAGAAGNPLIGKWKLVKPGCQVMTQIEYTPKEYAGFETPQGIYPGWRRIGVTYNVSPTEVWVLVNGAFSNKTRVFILDANHIKPDDGDGCIYERAH